MSADIFKQFLEGHTILKEVVRDNNGNSDDDSEEEDLLVPTHGNDHVTRAPCYPPHLQRIRTRDFYNDNHNFIIEVPLDELIAWDAIKGGMLAEKAEENTMRYQDLFSNVVDDVLKEMTGESTAEAMDTIDILHDQRVRADQEARANRGNGNDGEDDPLNNAGNMAEEGNTANNNNNGATEEFPRELMRRYELRILPRGRRGTLPPFTNQYFAKRTPAPLGQALRNVRSKMMGHLVTIRGMIVRASDVKPFCSVATYSCDACGVEIYQVVHNKREFMPANLCPSQQCRQNKQKSETLHLQTRGSKMIKFQELKLQELPNQVPMGHIPRSMSVYCRGDLTRLTTPGDDVTIDGVFLPQRIAESGYRAMKAGLISTTYLEAQNIVVHKKSYDESLHDSLSQEESAQLDGQIQKVATGPDPIGRLSSSIAPEIFGHEDIKRSLLLQLVGGCTRKLPDGMRIRGDINICLMGDPGVAKVRNTLRDFPSDTLRTNTASHLITVSIAQTRFIYCPARCLYYRKRIFWSWSHSGGHEGYGNWRNGVGRWCPSTR